ncbi:MAG: hypothetical protein QW040_00475 [Candidatus Aenigmatarchaeota archaeon]
MSNLKLERISKILEIIAKYYENPKLLLERLSVFEDAPSCIEEVDVYLQVILNCLFFREFGGPIFSDISYTDIREKIYPYMKEIFEKTQNKTILIREDVRENWVGFHPLLFSFYNIDIDGLSIELDVIVRYYDVELKAKGIEVYVPLTSSFNPSEIYIAFNPKDFLFLPGVSKLRTNYEIIVDEKKVFIDIFKQKRKEKWEPKVEIMLPELYLEIKEYANKLKEMAGNLFEPYLNLKMERKKLKEKLEEANLTQEEFYKSLLKTEELDKICKENLPLSEESFRLLYQKIAMEIIDYVNEKEKGIERIRKKIIDRLSE